MPEPEPQLDLDGLVAWLSERSSGDLDDMLEHRDSPEFDEQWTRLRATCSEVERHPRVEEAFLAVSNATAQHEIASYVAADLDLIHCSRLNGIQDPFLDLLLHSYAQGTFPHV